MSIITHLNTKGFCWQLLFYVFRNRCTWKQTEGMSSSRLHPRKSFYVSEIYTHAMTKFYLSTQISVLLQSQCVPLLFTSPTTFSIIYIAGTKDKLPERPQEPNQSQRNTTSHNHIDTLGFTLYSSCSKQCKGRKMQRTSGELKVKCLERERERETHAGLPTSER